MITPTPAQAQPPTPIQGAGTGTPSADGFPVRKRKISPTDISQYIRLDQCRRYLRLRLHERSDGRDFLTSYGVYPQEIPPLLTRSGSNFEREIEQSVRTALPTRNFADEARNRDRRPANNAELLSAARNLAPGETICLFQTRLVVDLAGWHIRGDADIVRLSRAEDGSLEALVADMKSSRAARVEYYLQVAFYHTMIEEVFRQAGMEAPRITQAILYRGPSEEQRYESEAEERRAREQAEREREAARARFGIDNALLEYVPDQQGYLDAVSDLVTAHNSTAAEAAEAPFDDIPYHVTYKCDGCIYNEFCLKWTAERDDLSLVPHLTPTDKEVLRRESVTTTRALARLKDFRQDDGARKKYDLVPAPGSEGLVRRLSAAWPVGPRIDEIVHRARRYRNYRKDPLEALSFIPSKGHGSLPYSAPDHNPNLVRVYIDAQHDYLTDRIYMLGALVAACEGGQESPNRRRTVVRMADGPVDTHDEEEALFLAWIGEVLRTVVELAAPGEDGKSEAPIHLIFFDRHEQTVLLDALGRHLPTILGATPLYDFITQTAAYDSPVLTFLSEEIRDLKNYPMMCQSLQSVAAWLKFDWRRDIDFRTLFRAGLFDFWGHLDEGTAPEGEQDWYTSRARFKSEIPLEYAYAAWGDLEAPPDGKADPFEHFRTATPGLMHEFEALRLEAMEHIARDFKGNYLTTKSAFSLPDLGAFNGKASSLARALEEFVAIERHVALGGWKTARNAAPERRVLTGETLLVRYVEADQDPEVAGANREAARRKALRDRYEAEFRAANPGKRLNLTKDQRAESDWSIDGIAYTLRLETEGTDASLDQVLALNTLREGERVVIFRRYVQDSRLPEAERTNNTPTPKQMLYGTRADIRHVYVTRDLDGNALSANVEIEIARSNGGMLGAFVFPSRSVEPLHDGVLYTLDSDPNDWYGYYCASVVESLGNMVEHGDTDTNTLYSRIAGGRSARVDWDERAAAGQQRFLDGWLAMHEAGAAQAFDLEPGKRDYISSHGTDPVLLVQGPPGTGKTTSTALAVFARIQGAFEAGREYRVLVSCKTHAAVDVLIASIRDTRDHLRDMAREHPDLFAQYFDPRLLDVPLFRIDPRKEHEGVKSLHKATARPEGDIDTSAALQVEPVCVAAATPGGIYRMLKDRWSKDLFGHYLCDCLVLDEASQMNLPEAVMAALPLHPEGQLVVVGDPRQMPPIVQHDWANERRRTFKQYQSYQSLFEALLDMPEPPPMVKFTESFRLHRDIAEFLRREIYSKDDIPYFSRKDAVLQGFDHEDPFVTAVLRPEHPIVVIVHDEAASQVRNPFEQRLVEPVLRALASDDKYNLSPEHGLGVVVPHRAQRADLLNAVDVLKRIDPETQGVLVSAVDTVERFQGDERTAILVSATESDRDYLLASSGFLYDPRRLTVAISRAKQKMVLVASRSVFTLFSPDEEAFANGQIWKNLLRRTCTTLLWEGGREDHHVQVWGNTLDPDIAPS